MAQSTQDQAIAKLEGMRAVAQQAFIVHTGDADGGEAYRVKFEELSDAISALKLAALNQAIAALTADFNGISDATSRLNNALTQISNAEDQLARFSSILNAAVNLITALQGGDLQAISDALSKIQTAFAPPPPANGN